VAEERALLRACEVVLPRAADARRRDARLAQAVARSALSGLLTTGHVQLWQALSCTCLLKTVTYDAVRTVHMQKTDKAGHLHGQVEPCVCGCPMSRE